MLIVQRYLFNGQEPGSVLAPMPVCCGGRLALWLAFKSPKLGVEIILDRGGVLRVDLLETGCGDLAEVDFLGGTRSLP